MPTTPDRPGGPEGERPTGPDTAARDTVPLDRRSPDEQGRRADPVNRTEPPDARPTERVEDRETVQVDLNRETVRIPAPRRPAGDAARRAPLPVAAAVAAFWAALVSFVPIAAVIGLARTLEGAGGLGGATQAGLAGWLLGHGVPLTTSIGPLGLPPLLLTLLAVWRLNRAGLHVTRAVGARRTGSVPAALKVAIAVGTGYAALGLLAALVVDGPGTQVSLPYAGISFLIIGFGGALIGSMRSTDALRTIARRVPPWVRHGLRTGVVAALLVLAAGAGVGGLAVAIGGGQATDMISAYRTGVGGQAGITLVSLAYGGNGAVWVAAYLLGPGFQLGTDSAIRVTEVEVGPLPTLPLLAGLPEGPTGAFGTALLAVPVLCAMAAGWALCRRLTRPRPPRPGASPAAVPAPAWSRLLASALCAGPVAGLLLGTLAWMSGGPLGDGRMSEIGPVPWHVAAVATAVVAVAAALGGAACRTFAGPRHP